MACDADEHARKVRMRLVSADSSTGQFPDPPDGDGAGGDGSTTRMLVRPVFTRGSERRRRMLVRGGYLAAASCVAYLAMVLVSVTASPSARPAASDTAGADQATLQQVTPERPSQKPRPTPALVRVRPVVPAPAPVTREPPPVTTIPTAAPSASVAPRASATPTKKGHTSASKSAEPSTAAAVSA
jgi:hypothetical protein